MDLVQLQIRIAAGEHLPFGQDDVKTRGHAIECRVNAEDPVKFFPSPGKLARFETPVVADGRFHDGVRVDAGYRAGDTVTPFYDSLLAKIIAHGETRAQATARMRERPYTLSGVLDEEGDVAKLKIPYESLDPLTIGAAGDETKVYREELELDVPDANLLAAIYPEEPEPAGDVAGATRRGVWAVALATTGVLRDRQA